ncbi:MAG: hypothetical protein R3310_14400, partial [Candidatus Competibacteraceae bacterium]|nr:hypothetical protein [Candidatus Competibacteraceae bacterium]
MAGGFVLGEVGWDEYVAARTAALDGPASDFAAGLPTDRDSWLWPWLARVGEYDPVQSWARARRPTLVI